MYEWTQQQIDIFDAVENKQNSLIKLDAIAGASKTTTLVEIAKRFKSANPTGTFRYIVFGRANFEDARTNFGTNAICSTIHAMAYEYIIRRRMYPLQTNIKSFLTWKDIPKSIFIPFGMTPLVIQLIENYCNSQYTSFNSYVVNERNECLASVVKAATQVMQQIVQGKIPPTHSFYLKLFHKAVVSNSIQLDHTDILAVDEAGDLTPITFDIFDKYPAEQKIMCGDKFQAIFSFMGCINGFEKYNDQGITLNLNKSFRCSTQLAPAIEVFGRTYFNDPTFTFNGHTYTNQEVKTIGYITRTNMELIETMINFNQQGIDYRLVSKSKTDQLFRYPEFLMYMAPNRKVYDRELRVLQHDVDEYYSSQALQSEFSSATKYLLHNNEGNENLVQATKLLAQFDRSDIIEAKNQAQSHTKQSANIILGTAHVFKGLTVDKVVISKLLNKSLDPLVKKDPTKLSKDELSEFLLYYVACTRARYEIENAKHLKLIDIGETISGLY